MAAREYRAYRNDGHHHTLSVGYAWNGRFRCRHCGCEMEPDLQYQSQLEALKAELRSHQEKPCGT